MCRNDIVAQRAKKINERTTKTDSGVDTSVLEAEKHFQIEKQYLQAAKKNIEKYRKGEATILLMDSTGRPLRNLSVSINQVSQDFLFGNLSEEVFRSELTSEEFVKFTEMFKAIFNFTELTVKWTPYEMEQGKPQWQKLQQKLDWCRQNNIVAKGHTLGWTNMAGTPPWVLRLPYELATALYKARIQNLVGGFKDQIKIWDVVNEPVTTIPWEKALRDSIFGPGKIDEGSRYSVNGITLEETLPWVEKSFQWAYEADSKGDFIVNEFYVIARPAVREKFYRLVSEMQKRKTPVTGVGIQAHEPREMWFSPIEIIKTFDKFKELGLPIHITEFIPQSSGKTITGDWRQGTWTEDAQADFAEMFYTLAFSHPSMASIHWWGLSDRFIWLKGGGLLDRNLNPKPVYTRLKKLIKEEWMTKNVRLSSTNNGELSFRGFFGSYQVVVTKTDGSVSTFSIHLKDKNANTWNFKL
ncbi:MAG: endo-1,4-beta-xylanase [Chitinophagaceae bacterium]|nr:endo-1,4-beta-xylanase [Chitinophagaceae bacterium]